MEQRKDQLKIGEEKGLDFRRSHEDHMLCLETERNSCLQTTQLRAHFVEAVAKEQEDRIMDISKHRSELSNFVCDWQALRTLVV